jgi:hypothetical protein
VSEHANPDLWTTGTFAMDVWAGSGQHRGKKRGYPALVLDVWVGVAEGGQVCELGRATHLK